MYTWTCPRHVFPKDAPMSDPSALVAQDTLLDRFALALATGNDVLALSLRMQCLSRPHLALGVPLLASHESARAARNQLFVVHHPDKGGSAQAFDLVNQCYEAFVSTRAEVPVSAERLEVRERHAAFMKRCEALLGKIDALPNTRIGVTSKPAEPPPVSVSLPETPEPEEPLVETPSTQKKRKVVTVAVAPIGTRLRSTDFKNRLRVRK